MKIIKATEFNILPNEEITENLMALIESLKNIDGEKTVVFEEGFYFLDSGKCNSHMLFITNTVGDKEFSADEMPHKNAVPFYFDGLSDIVFDGGNSTFVIDGKVTNVAMENCENILLKNMEIRHSHPDMHEMKVVDKSLFSVEFEIDRDSQYEFENGKLVFYGKDYRVCADENAANAHWIGLIRKELPNKIKRVKHPLFSATKISGAGDRKIRVSFPNTVRFKNGDCFYLFDVRRQFAGIFINKCKNISLENIKQCFNYSLALVVQDSENIKADHIDFSPAKDSARKMASVADFIQICMCRGNIIIENSKFDGAGDDCLNVHGIHFKITEVLNNQITVRFMHPQSHGFNPLRVGDAIAYIDTDTLLETGSAVIEKSELINEYEIKLSVSNTSGTSVGAVIEDTSACPDLSFINNSVNRIITRGLLITTRGKVSVMNNHFISTTMSGILLSDDAKNWYESGMCRDVTIMENVFEYCGGTPVLIKPEISNYRGAVHKNIRIISNQFNSYKGYCIKAKATDNISVKENHFSGKKVIQALKCNNVSE